MSLAEDDEKPSRRFADSFLDGTSHSALDRQRTALSGTNPQAAADQVADQWMDSARSLVLACAYFVGALHTFDHQPSALVRRLIAVAP